jgi:SAM-dependent methyltransferase
MDPRSLLRVHEDDADYRRQAAAEAEFWHRMHPQGLEAVQSNLDEGPVDRRFNLRFAGSEGVRWWETIARHGGFRRGAVLGTSSLVVEGRILETNPQLHLTFFDISEGALARRESTLGSRFPGRVATRVADLNFVELPASEFDVIVSSSAFHHVTNLEYLAWQINQALAAAGYFFLEDYVGEPRFQFSDDKKRIYRELFNRDRARQGRPPVELHWSDTGDLSPFCGVRSDEVLGVLRRYLEESELKTIGGLVTPIVRSRAAEENPHSPWAGDAWVAAGSRWRFLLGVARHLVLRRPPSPQTMLGEDFLQEIFLVGDVLTAAGILAPSNAFASYRKKR